MKAAFLDPNPVIMLEHKGLYWSKVPGTLEAMTIEPSPQIISSPPLGKGRYRAGSRRRHEPSSLTEWACIGQKPPLRSYPGSVEIIDLSTLYPLDEELVFATVRKHGKCLVLTEEQLHELIRGKRSPASISLEACFRWLDAPVMARCRRNGPAGRAFEYGVEKGDVEAVPAEKVEK